MATHRALRFLLLVSLFSLTGCDSGDAADAATDAASDAATDAGAAVSCERDIDCANELFCDGRELCMPGDSRADARGCIAGAPPCAAMQTCSETGQRCESDCDTTPDLDGDGSLAENCGGDDCDDADPAVFPGATEICDAEGRDEDCDPATLAAPADTDLDGDGFVSDACCNLQDTGALRCGLDCDDDQPAARFGLPEACDGIDNDCDAMTDEGVQTTYYRDVDEDLYGDEEDTMRACAQPEGYTANPGDCDDVRSDVNPLGSETCDDADEDCDTRVDEEVSPRPETAENCGACGATCPSGYTCNVDVCEDPAVQVAAGQGLVVVLGASGRVYQGALGSTSTAYEPVAGIDNATQVAASEATGCAALADGGVACWGRRFTDGSVATTAERVPGLSAVVRVDVGEAHACALTDSRDMFCWGDNEDGQLGSGDTLPQAAPVRMAELPAGAALDIAAGDRHSCQTIVDGRTFCWGTQRLGSNTVVELSPGDRGVTGGRLVGASELLNAAGTLTGVEQWGFMSMGGSPVTGVPGSRAVDLDVMTGTAVGINFGSGGSCSSSTAHACLVSEAGQVFCWGDSDDGQLGPGSSATAFFAQVVPLSDGATSVAAGYVASGGGGLCSVRTSGFSCATLVSGALRCWGVGAATPIAVAGFPVTVEPET